MIHALINQQKLIKKKKTGRDHAASGDARRDDEANRRVVVPADKYGLEALLDNKDKLVNIPANDGSGRNMYQVEMEKLKAPQVVLQLLKKNIQILLLKWLKVLENFLKKEQS